ncbi:MAG: DUF2461 family protein [Saprospiraceae bacterium]|nr:DUF2461 family protein [Saprospiraceae bacterium]
MKSSTIQSSTIQFLADLAQNNNRDWFNDQQKQLPRCTKMSLILSMS